MNLSQYKYIYFIGIGGIGMSALARYFNLKRKIVFGYDAIKSDLCIELQREGISVCYEEYNIPKQIKECKSSKILAIYTPAVNKENELAKNIHGSGYSGLNRNGCGSRLPWAVTVMALGRAS